MKTENKVSRSKGASGDLAAVDRLFFLEASGGRVMSANPDGSDRKVIATGGRVPMASSLTQRQGTSTGQTWAFRI